ncbi:hypothetical protein D3C78_1411610 [compost metagenome]
MSKAMFLSPTKPKKVEINVSGNSSLETVLAKISTIGSSSMPNDIAVLISLRVEFCFCSGCSSISTFA